MPESHSLQTSARVFAGYKTYAGGSEVVGARSPADIGAEEGAPATVSVVGRVEEVFSAVEVTRVQVVEGERGEGDTEANWVSQHMEVSDRLIKQRCNKMLFTPRIVVSNQIWQAVRYSAHDLPMKIPALPVPPYSFEFPPPKHRQFAYRPPQVRLSIVPDFASDFLADF